MAADFAGILGVLERAHVQLIVVVLDLGALVRAKRAASRPKDLEDSQARHRA